MFQIRTMSNFETEVYEPFEAFLLVQAIMNMTPKRLAIALRLPSEGPSSRCFTFSHDKTPNLMVFSEISF